MSNICCHVGPHTRSCGGSDFIETSGLFGATRIQWPAYTWTWSHTEPVVCEHCFCKRAPYVDGVPHNACCHCGQTHASVR